MIYEFELDENLLLLDTLLIYFKDFGFDKEIDSKLNELYNVIENKLYSQIKNGDLEDYKIIFRYFLEKE